MFRVRIDLGQGKGDGAARFKAELPVERDLPQGGVPVFTHGAGGDDFDARPAPCAHGVEQGQEFVLVGEGAGHRISVDRGVKWQAIARKRDSARFDALAHDSRHPVDLRGARRSVVGRPVRAEDVGADGAVGNLCRDLDATSHGLKGIEVFRKALPRPTDPVGKGGTGDVFDPFHQLDQFPVSLGPHGCETDAAIAHDDAGHAVPG